MPGTASGRVWRRGGCVLLVLALAGCAAPASLAPAASAETKPPDRLPAQAAATAGGHSAHVQLGKASIYSRSFDGRTMADGRRYNPDTNVAASKTLPLGTVAKVTNLENGKSAEVRVEDRGPFVRGRVVDLTPKTARKIGLTKKQGIVRVAVKPLAVPKPGGGKPVPPQEELAASGAAAP